MASLLPHGNREKIIIYLLRHGALDLPCDDAMVGQIDLALSVEGIRQAEQWRDALAGCFLDRIYCNNLGRSLHTAHIIAGHRKEIIHLEPDLREINLGDWDGLSRYEIAGQFPIQWKERQKDLFGHQPPGGESFIDLYNRVVPVFERIVGTLTGDTLIVGHAGVNRVLVSWVLGMPLEHIFRIKQDYGGMHILECVRGDIAAVALNRKLP